MFNEEVFLDESIKGRGFSGVSVGELGGDQTHLCFGRAITWGEEIKIATVDDRIMGIHVYGTGEFYTELQTATTADDVRRIMLKHLYTYYLTHPEKEVNIFARIQKNAYNAGRNDGAEEAREKMREALGLR